MTIKPTIQICRNHSKSVYYGSKWASKRFQKTWKSYCSELHKQFNQQKLIKLIIMQSFLLMIYVCVATIVL